MKFHDSLMRNIDAGDLLEDFLIAAVSSVFVIRFYLFITGYPQVGGRSFHFAHMLFGGFFMLAAIILLITYLNRTVLQWAAVLGGIGFGTFIDELGKFITRDNNYFYQPTAALMYVVFIMLFLVFRLLEHDTRLTKREYLLNALERMEDVVLQDLSTDEKRQTMKLLRKCDSGDPIVKALKQVLEKTTPVPHKKNILEKMAEFFSHFYRDIIENKYFTKGIILFFILKAILTLYTIGTYIMGVTKGFPVKFPAFAFVQYGEFVSVLAADTFIILGVFVIYKSRILAYQMFRRSILVSIFFTQFFLFYREQFIAVESLVLNIIVLIALQYMITQERQKE